MGMVWFIYIYGFALFAIGVVVFWWGLKLPK